MSDTWNDLTEDDWHQLTQDDWHQSLFSSEVTVCDPTTVKFAALAAKLINKFIGSNNAVWVSTSNNVVDDADKPYVVSKPIAII